MCSEGRTRSFGRMERTRQPHENTCSGPRHLESSASGQTGLDREAETPDPLAEEETILQFESFMCERKELDQRTVPNALNSLARTLSQFRLHRTSELAVEEVGPLNSSEVIPETEQLAEMAQDEPRADKRLKSESCRTQVLGDNPKEVRDCAQTLVGTRILRIGFWS